MSHNHANLVLNSVANSMTEIDVEPPGYDTPDITKQAGSRATSMILTMTIQRKLRILYLAMSKKPAPIPHLVAQDPTTMRWT